MRANSCNIPIKDRPLRLKNANYGLRIDGAYSEGCLAFECAHRRLVILPSRAPQFLAPEQLRRPFHSGGGLDLLWHGAIRRFCGPIR